MRANGSLTDKADGLVVAKMQGCGLKIWNFFMEYP